MKEKISENSVERLLDDEKAPNSFLKYLDLGIIILAIIIFMIVYHYETQELTLKYILMGICLAIVFYYAKERLTAVPAPVQQHLPEPVSAITSINMLNENGNIIKKWDLHAKVALVIGKGGKNRDVFIDLSESMYDGLIHDEHAVLNFVNGDWYLEGLHTPTSISLKKAADQMRYRLTGALPLKIQKGDVIYIAKTRLLVR